MKNSTKVLSGLLGVAALALTFTAAGCTSKSSSGGSGTVSITGAGSTFVYPIMTRWIADYHQAHPTVQVNYQSIGSGGGIQQVKNGTVDFGASDAALTDQQMSQMTPVVQFPESAGPVCITYNLPSLSQPLHLTAATLSGIYLGTIKNWHDAAIAKANPGVKLPNTPILVVHRSDGSGTTNIFTTYLSAVNPTWASKVGKGISVNWPVGLGGKGSEGVTGLVKQTEGAIGFVELSYAISNHLPVAAMQNKAGEFVEPSAQSTSAAIGAFADALSKDVRNPIVDANAPGAYPIAGLTFLIIPKDGKNVARRQAMKDFIKYVLTDGQNSVSSLNYPPLPQSIQQLDLKVLDQITANGQPLK